MQSYFIYFFKFSFFLFFPTTSFNIQSQTTSGSRAMLHCSLAFRSVMPEIQCYFQLVSHRGKCKLKYKAISMVILCIQTVKKITEICFCHMYISKKVALGLSCRTRNDFSLLCFYDVLFFLQRSSLRLMFAKKDLFAYYSVVHHGPADLSSSEKSVQIKCKLQHQNISHSCTTSF